MKGEHGGRKFLERDSHKGKGIAVFTSGGDSQVSISFLKLVSKANTFVCII